MYSPFLVHSATKARVIRCIRTYNIALITTMLRIERGFIEPIRLQVRRESDQSQRRSARVALPLLSIMSQVAQLPYCRSGNGPASNVTSTGH